MKVFGKHKTEIEMHNALNVDKAGFEMEVNQFTDMSDEER